MIRRWQAPDHEAALRAQRSPPVSWSMPRWLALLRMVVGWA